jgi:chromosome condensin MukBEF ATPase and DNA-binding subunit MukB
MTDELISELQREWREQVLIRLNNLAEGQEKINEKISTLENTFARESRLEKIITEQQLVNNNLQDRITKLEGIYMKALGAGFVIQVIFGAVIAFLTHK